MIKGLVCYVYFFSEGRREKSLEIAIQNQNELDNEKTSTRCLDQPFSIRNWHTGSFFANYVDGHNGQRLEQGQQLVVRSADQFDSGDHSE